MNRASLVYCFAFKLWSSSSYKVHGAQKCSHVTSTCLVWIVKRGGGISRPPHPLRPLFYVCVFINLTAATPPRPSLLICVRKKKKKRIYFLISFFNCFMRVTFFAWARHSLPPWSRLGCSCGVVGSVDGHTLSNIRTIVNNNTTTNTKNRCFSLTTGG